ncbi:rhodanese-like domain-containing protein [Demequina mangrovi]|uniref:Rhodanese-related sulfurtransferase n=1 Tax=Demequina mangrovi TaxID=1043493 RepID=A0A1H6W4V5_9MICO|nr:rhodanese-like domain-containing protein [Demequina mangrovi]SEJ11999.1 Rhodanese-related sulfurtransferase [Demequina mangrovi]
METTPELAAHLAAARAHFAGRLAFETDVSDAHAALEAGEPGVVLIDTRNREAWDQGHARGAIHLPKPDMPARIPAEFAPGTRFIVYCWGPGCNGATRAGLIISELGYEVKEMIGGFEYWAREGFPVDKVVRDDAGNESVEDGTYPVDPLTSPLPVAGNRIVCDC